MPEKHMCSAWFRYSSLCLAATEDVVDLLPVVSILFVAVEERVTMIYFQGWSSLEVEPVSYTHLTLPTILLV